MATTNQNTPRSLELRSKLDELKAERSNLDNLPSKAPIEAAIARLTSQHALHPEKWRSSLEAAVAELADLEEKIARRQTLNSEIIQAQTDLDLELGQIKAGQMQDINKRYAEIATQYKAACLTAAEQHRKLLDYCKQNGIQTPPRFDQFHIPHLMGFGWSGTLGETMQQGTAPFEQNNEGQRHDLAA